jgi:hypothetical protein
MLFRVNWTIKGSNRDEVTRRFLGAADDPNYDLPEGLAMTGRWHNLAAFRGTAIMETDDIGLLYGWLTNWNDVCDTEVDAVVEDEECGAILAEMMSRNSS